MIALGLDIDSAKKKIETQKILTFRIKDFNTGRLLFKFNGLQYHFGARKVAFANHVIVCRLGKGSTTPETQMDLDLAGKRGSALGLEEVLQN